MRILRDIVCAVLVSASMPATADTVTCGDGTKGESGPGACALHGGVVSDRAKPRAERPRAQKRSQARRTTTRKRTQVGVLCNDGTRSDSTASTACSDHDGIAGTIVIEPVTPAPRSGAKASRPQPRIEREAAARPSEPLPRDTDSVLCNDGTVSTPIGRGACTGHGGISNGAEKFERHEGPIRERAPSTSSGDLCADGTRSTTAGPSACADHGGLARPRLPGAGEPAPGAPVALCKDGEVSYDYPAGGTCSNNGGVERWL